MCKHDDQYWYEKYLNLSKHRNLIYDLYDYIDAPKITDKVQQLAEKHSVTTRTVFRMKKRLKCEELDFELLDLFGICSLLSSIFDHGVLESPLKS